jgi:hypothetical protein
LKLVDMELKDSIHAVLETGAFVRYHILKPPYQNNPQHLSCLDKKYMIYMDYGLPYYRTDRKTRYSIRDFSRREIPEISFEEFFVNQATDEVRNKLLFHLNLF